MENAAEFIGSFAGIMFLLLLVLIIILALITLGMSLRLSRLNRKYQIFMKGKDAQSMESVFKTKLSGIEKITNQCDNNKVELDILKKKFKTTLTHYGIVKYDAFDDVGGKMSFALAMLDDNHSGFILNTIHSQDNCFQYIKEIVNGESYIMLSNEEVEALNNAMADIDEEKL